MTASPTTLLIIYGSAIAVVSLLGGFLPNWVRMTHTRTQMIMSFVSGFMLAVAFFHLLPHSLVLVGGVGAADEVAAWLMLGLVGMLLMLRLFHFHQHDFSDAEHSHHDHHHEATAHSLSWIGIALGLGLHTLIDGVALGAALYGANTPGVTGLLGFGVFLAMRLHKPLDAMSVTSIMEAGGWGKSARTAMNVVFALLCPLGAALFYFGIGATSADQQHIVGLALAFAAGAFVCIALSDLLPEVHFHSHDRGKLTAAFLAGIALAWAIGIFEPASSHQLLHATPG